MSCHCPPQVEAFDSEIESLQSTVKRKQKPPARLAHLEESVTRHKTHIGRLEQIIRLLDNDALQPDDVSRVVMEEIPEYIENNQEDFDAYEVHFLATLVLPQQVHHQDQESTCSTVGGKVLVLTSCGDMMFLMLQAHWVM